MNLRQAAQRALKAMEDGEYRAAVEFSDALIALRAALDEPQTTHWEGCEEVHPECRKPEQEPVAWELRMGKTDRVLIEITNNPKRAQDWRASLCEVVPLYYAPTPRKPLTDLEYALDALRQMVEGMEQASVGERIDFQGYAMGGRSVLEKLRGSNE